MDWPLIADNWQIKIIIIIIIYFVWRNFKDSLFIIKWSHFPPLLLWGVC